MFLFFWIGLVGDSLNLEDGFMWPCPDHGVDVYGTNHVIFKMLSISSSLLFMACNS